MGADLEKMFKDHSTYDNLFMPGEPLNEDCKKLFHLLIQTQQCAILQLILQKNPGLILTMPYEKLFEAKDEVYEVESNYLVSVLHLDMKRLLKLILNHPEINIVFSA